MGFWLIDWLIEWLTGWKCLYSCLWLLLHTFKKKHDCIVYFSICQLSSVVPLCDVGRAGHTSTPLYILLTTRDGSATCASESMNVCLCFYLWQCCNNRLLDYDQVNSDTMHTLCVCVYERESMCMCVCVCVWEREYVHVYERECARVCVCMREYVHVCVCMRERVCARVCVCERERERENMGNCNVCVHVLICIRKSTC